MYVTLEYEITENRRRFLIEHQSAGRRFPSLADEREEKFSGLIPVGALGEGPSRIIVLAVC